jgi:hypothetical protein
VVPVADVGFVVVAVVSASIVVAAAAATAAAELAVVVRLGWGVPSRVDDEEDGDVLL